MFQNYWPELQGKKILLKCSSLLTSCVKPTDYHISHTFYWHRPNPRRLEIARWSSIIFSTNFSRIWLLGGFLPACTDGFTVPLVQAIFSRAGSFIWFTPLLARKKKKRHQPNPHVKHNSLPWLITYICILSFACD